MLRSRGYAETSSIKLVGDRYQLTARQRIAVARCACGENALTSRRNRCVAPEGGKGRDFLIDGFNVLTTLEAALAGGVLLRGRDGCIRDMTSMHGNYRVLSQTVEALGWLIESFVELGPGRVIIYLDRPVSNSGRLRAVIREVADSYSSVRCEVRLVKDPDAILKRSADKGIVASADSGILDHCGEWFNLASFVLSRERRDGVLVDLS